MLGIGITFALDKQRERERVKWGYMDPEVGVSEEVEEQESLREVLNNEDRELVSLIASKSGYYETEAQLNLAKRLRARECGVRSGDLSKVTVAGYIDFNLRSAHKEANNPRLSKGQRFEVTEKLKRLEEVKRAWEAGDTGKVGTYLENVQQEALEKASHEIRAMTHPTHFGRPDLTPENLAIGAINQGVEYKTATILRGNLKSSGTRAASR